MSEISCPCGRIHVDVSVLPLVCRCGRRHGVRTTTPTQPRNVGPSPRRRTLQSYINEIVGCGCNSSNPETVAAHAGLQKSRAEEYLDIAKRLYTRQFRDTALITTHWNPLGYRRLKATYDAWRPTIPFDVICMEMILDDSEPEIPGSVVVRGTKDNVLWQKERLTNLAIEQLPPSIRYVVWIDHDCVFADPEWLNKSITVLDSGYDALQPYSKLERLDQHGKVERSDEVSASWQLSQGPVHSGSMPGLVWVATKEFLDRSNNLYEGNIVGGGDAVWFTGVTGHRDQHFPRLGAPMAEDARRWIRHFGGGKCGYVPGVARHLWHGKMVNRQYVSRDAIPRDHDFDPVKHLEIDENGLLRFSKQAPPGLAEGVYNYFINRRDDG